MQPERRGTTLSLGESSPMSRGGLGMSTQEEAAGATVGHRSHSMNDKQGNGQQQCSICGLLLEKGGYSISQAGD